MFDGVGVNGFGALCPWCFDDLEEGKGPLTAWWQHRSLRAWCATTLANSDVLPLALRRETVALGIAACLVDEYQAINTVGARADIQSALSQVSRQSISTGDALGEVAFAPGEGASGSDAGASWNGGWQQAHSWEGHWLHEHGYSWMLYN